MALPQAIVQNVGGTIYVDAPVRAGAAPTVVVRNSSNTVIVASTAATLDAVNTTLSSAGARGDYTLGVASAANVVAGRQYRLGPATPAGGTEQPEFVMAQSISGTTVTLARPLRYAHVNGVAFAGTRLSYAVTSTQATTLFWDGHAEWNLNTTVAEQNIFTGVECVLRPLVRLCQLEDVGAIWPKVMSLLDRESNPTDMLDRAFERVLQAFGSSFRARTLIGSDALIEVTAFRCLYDIARAKADEAGEKRWTDELTTALDEIRSTRPADNDQDGAVETHEGPYTTGKVQRS